MKKLFFLILLLTGLAGFAFSPPVIQTPTDIEVCDQNNDGFEVFDLTPKISEVLGALNPSDYTVNFYETLTDANTGASPIPVINAYAIINNPMTIYVRVQDNIDSSSFSTASFNLIAVPIPVAGTPVNLTVEDVPYDGIAVFDLTLNENILVNGSPSNYVSYHLTLPAALAQTSPIAAPSAYIGTNGQTIWAAVHSVSGCFTTASFKLFVVDPSDPNLINIPDGNFKAKLISLGVDTNEDGQIQISEALVPTSLDVSDSNILDLTGIQYFTNLTQLNCSLNGLSEVDLSALINLITLDCSSNYLTTINVGSLTNLTSLSLVNNQLLEIENLSLLVNLTNLNFYQNEVSTVNLSPLVNLTNLNTGNNPLTTLNVSNNTSLTYLFCPQNLLTSIDVSSLINLKFFYCYSNQLSTLNLTNNNALIFLYCSGNQLTSLNISNLHSLTNLDCSTNLITNLDVSGTNMSSIICSFNPLTSLNLSGLNGINHLGELYCNYTNLTSINLDAGLNIDQNLILECNNNNQLVSIFAKNGSVQQNVSFSGNPNLAFICVDDANEADLFQSYVNSYGYTNCVINSYCSFTPGGNFNTIAAHIKYDSNENGCDAADEDFPNMRVNIDDSTDSGASFTNLNGIAAFYTQAGSFTITPGIENPEWYTISPPSVVIPFFDNNNNVVSQDFCITPNGIHPDLEIIITPITLARPGFTAEYKIVYRNKGNQTISQMNDGISFTYDYTRMNLLSTSEPLSLIVAPPGTLNWDLNNLSPFESRSILLTFQINSPASTIPVNIGDVLPFNAVVNPIAGDETPSDNTFHYDQTVVGSFDPNDITCIEGDLVSPAEIGNYLHYVINFENTGTAEAENIVVKDVIDNNQFDVNSLQVLNSSAQVMAKLTGNVAQFIFQNINLHSGGHGNILIKIKSKNTLVQGDSVSKKANIYFDYNFPVETLPANTIFQSLNNPDIPIDESITVYPNPTKGSINIVCSNTIESVQLYDVQGRLLETGLINETNTVMDISDKSDGVYFLKVKSEKGIVVQKIVKK